MQEKNRKKNVFLISLAAVFLAVLFFCLLFWVRRNMEKREPRIFGSTYMTMNNPYFTALNESIREVVEANGDILISRDPAQSQTRQNEQILEMIDEGMSVLFANAVDWETIEPALSACREAGVAVFVVDTNVENNDEVISVIQSDNYQAGVLVAEDLMKKRPQGADIVVMNHYNVYSTVERRQGFLDTLSGHPEYRIIAETDNTSEIEVSTREMDKMLKRGIEFDAVFGNNDPTALGALAAIQMNKVEKPILIYGVDGSPDAKAMIEKGQMEGTAAQYPIKMGKTAIETAYRYLDGEEVPEEIKIGVTMITLSTLKDYDVNEWQ